MESFDFDTEALVEHLHQGQRLRVQYARVQHEHTGRIHSVKPAGHVQQLRDHNVLCAQAVGLCPCTLKARSRLRKQ